MKRRLAKAALALLAIVLLVVAGAWLGFRASLPQLDGEQALAGLVSPVTVTRDATGVVTVRASSATDLARATGFVHAQERFFQMDLLRRSAAGEISALVGAAAVEFDKARRIHRMRAVARRVRDALGEEQRRVLEAYAAGVNAGLAALGARPFEYAVLRVDPEPWRAEDSLLVILAMYFDLHDETARRERSLAALRDVFPAPFVDFLVPRGTRWDAPLVGDALPVPAVPGPAIVDFRKMQAAIPAPATEPAFLPGSNNWAVSGALTDSGRPIVANDMHLGLGLPNTWFRLRLELDAPGGYAVTGVSLPGLPAIIAGSNGRIAWGFTNSYGDWIDLVRLETSGCEHGYRVPGAAGCRAFDEIRTDIEIAHADAEPFTFRATRWGPVYVEPRADGELLYALRWTAHDPAATNLHLRQFARAMDVDDALGIAHRAGMPPQNLVVADAGGDIAWTLIGRIPVRNGHDGQQPLESGATGNAWSGWVAPEDYPVIRNPAHGRIWTANARVVDGADLRLVGDGGYALGARARQIRDRLFEKPRFDGFDMLAIQLDIEARFLARWHGLLMRTLDDTAIAAEPERRALLVAAENWEGSASVDAVSYRLVRAFRAAVFDAVFGGLTAPVTARYPDFRFGVFTQSEGPLWRLLEARPAHLVPPGHASWRELLLDAADEVRLALVDDDRPGERTWGERNLARLRHPLGDLPLLDELVNAEPRALPGDKHMPRVQGPDFGASERFAVSPGNEAAGYFHMPGGQSGHPLSPFYLAGHDDWETGRATPFLPGPARYTLILLPEDKPE